jgi:hypothetical protein
VIFVPAVIAVIIAIEYQYKLEDASGGTRKALVEAAVVEQY